MSLRNVWRLYGVYRKSYRLIGKNKFRRYRESRLRNWAGHLISLLIGLGIGGLIALPLGMAWSGAAADTQQSIRDAAAAIFVALPVFGVLYSLYFAQMSQMQRMGAKTSVEPIYWFPLTWEEHTLASVLTNMTTPLALTAFLLLIVLPPAAVIGMVPQAVLMIAALVVGVVMTGATSEILKGAQTRITSYVGKRAGRMTVWARFVATIGFIVIIYVGYFLMNRNFVGIAESLSDQIMIGWFIPYLWPGIVLFEAYHGLWPEALAFVAASIVFTWALYRIAVRSNARLAMHESSAFRITKGAYAPGRGLLERLGIPPAVSAIMRKDLRAYTRRQELMYVFITPIIFVVSTLMPFVTGGSGQGADAGSRQYQFMLLSLEPALVLAAFLGASVVGSEGERLWFLVMSPLPARSFVRAKYLFTALICAVVALCSVGLACLLFAPSPYAAATALVEALLLIGCVTMVALAFGTAGADFRELAKTRTVRPWWMMGCVAACAVVALVVFLPALAYGIVSQMNGLSHDYLYAAWGASAVLALAIGGLAYVIGVRMTEKLFASRFE